MKDPTWKRREATSARRRAKVPTEHTEQAKLVARIKLFHPDVLIASVPNGGKREPREAVRLKAEGVLAGYPDLLVDEARGGYFGLRIEMKRQKGGSVSKAQREVHERLMARGYRVAICKGVEEAWNVFERYMKLAPTRATLERRTRDAV